MMKLSVGASVPLVRPHPCILSFPDATIYWYPQERLHSRLDKN